MGNVARRDFLYMAASALVSPELVLPALAETLVIGTLMGTGDEALSRGIDFGVREANQSGALFGWTVRRRDGRAATDAGIDIVGRRDLPEQIGARALVLHAFCTASRRVADVGFVVGDCRRSSTSSTAVVEWFGGLERFGAAQLNDRFRTAHGFDMTADAWIGWFSVKLLLDSAMRARSVSPERVAAHLRDESSRFDGHKGTPLFFRSGRLVQPVYLLTRGSNDWTLERELPPEPA